MRINNYTALSSVHVVGSLILAYYQADPRACIPSVAIFVCSLGYDTVVHLFERWEEKRKMKDKHANVLAALEAGGANGGKDKKEV